MRFHGPLIKASLENLSSAPASPVSGQVYYDTTLKALCFYNGSSWVSGGALLLTGSTGSPQSITATGGIAFSGSNPRSLWFIQGSAGAVTVTASPQIAAGTTAGQELILIGTSDTSTVTITDGGGLSLNGSMTFYNYSNLYLVWDGSVWAEIARRM